mgnify:CR=1 FL=1
MCIIYIQYLESSCSWKGSSILLFGQSFFLSFQRPYVFLVHNKLNSVQWYFETLTQLSCLFTLSILHSCIYEFFICFILHSKFTSYFSQKLNMIYSQHKCQAFHYEKSMQFTSLHKFTLVSRDDFHVSDQFCSDGAIWFVQSSC